MGSEKVYDEDQFVGMLREQVVHDSTITKPVSRTVNVPWRSSALGVDGAVGWRTARTVTTFSDSYGTTESVQYEVDITKWSDHASAS